MAVKPFGILLSSILVLLTLTGCQGEVNVTRLSEVLGTLVRQTMMQQLAMEERTRSDGHSGVKQTRFAKDGTHAYMTSSHMSNSAASMHDHANHYKTVGIGEFVAVMNGVEFRTRHNDYMLKRPSPTSTDYKAVEEIEYPAVPQAVLDQDSLQGQVEEMREWFKAWVTQDHKERDYRDYFKPVLCYMEGTWTETDFGEVEEPFESDRHKVSADNWYDLHEKIRFTSYTGGKEKGENYAFLPTKIMDFDPETQEPVYAQWNYRILCHELKEDLPLSYFQPAGDLHKRMAVGMRYNEFTESRSQRFLLNNKPTQEKRLFRWDYLETLMNQIPGLNNYPADIVDRAFGQRALDPFSEDEEVKNAGYYHSWYRFEFADAMGQGQGHRGFSDRNLYVAFNEQPHVLPKSARWCEVINDEQVCETSTSRVSYAIPMEIVYLTPLHRWNPYDIKMWPREDRKEVTKGGRKGLFEPDTAWNGNNDDHFYMTPHEFFNGAEVDTDPADTTAPVAGVLDQTNTVRNVSASGVRIFLPSIPGVGGNLRTRFPIFPVHEEGSLAFKETEALREIVMDMKKYITMFKVLPEFSGGSSGDDIPEDDIAKTLYLSESTETPPDVHYHTVYLTNSQFAQMTVQGKMLTLATTKVEGHYHTLRVSYDSVSKTYSMIKCDGKKRECWDGHPLEISEEPPAVEED